MTIDSSLNPSIAIILGASEWPSMPTLNEDPPKFKEAFKNSAEDLEAYLQNPEGLNIPEENFRNLFNSDLDPNDHDKAIGDFLKQRIKELEKKDRNEINIFVFYIGHGTVLGDNEYYLAIKTTREENQKVSSIEWKNLVKTIASFGRRSRNFIVLDACSSGLASTNIETTAINIMTEETIKSIETDTPTRGLALLCSSEGKGVSKNLGEEHTMFSGALLNLLKHGSPSIDKEYFSLREIEDLITKDLANRYHINSVKAGVFDPIQPEGRLSDFPVFRNLGFMTTKKPNQIPAPDDKYINCCVITSESEIQYKTRGDYYSLGDLVNEALVTSKNVIEDIINRPLRVAPIIVNVTNALASRKNLDATLELLCSADILVFDITNFEPAMMFLLGIRSVTRRGITIASYGKEYRIGDFIELPFNIKEVNLVSHSVKQVESEDQPAADLLANKIVAGVKELEKSPTTYLDLPVYDAVRKLSTEDKPIGYEDRILFLCPFSANYQSKNWGRRIRNHLYSELKSREKSPEFVRTLDMRSPRLVSQTLYEAIRLTSMCLVDWTGWRPNVFFELGIRLAVNDINPVIIIEDIYNKMIENPDQLENLDFQADGILYNPFENDSSNGQSFQRHYANDQYKQLLTLFSPITYNVEKYISDDYKRMVEKFHELEAKKDYSDDNSILPPGHIRFKITQFVDSKYELSSFPLYEELSHAADRLSTEGKVRSPLLFPKNPTLTSNAEKNAIERLKAAWFYMDNNFSQKHINANSELKQSYQEIGNKLAASLLNSSDDAEVELGAKIYSRIELSDMEN